MQPKIKLKLHIRQVEMLENAHSRPVSGTGDYKELLEAHRLEFLHYFRGKMMAWKQSYTIEFTPVQACAFMKLWLGTAIPGEAGILILQVIGNIDKSYKQALIQEHAHTHRLV